MMSRWENRLFHFFYIVISIVLIIPSLCNLQGSYDYEDSKIIYKIMDNWRD